jgi:hypothetical protein
MPIGTPARPGDDEGREPARLDVLADAPDDADVQHGAAGGNEERRTQRVEHVQPQRARRERESEAGGADRKRPEEGAEPHEGENVKGDARHGWISRRRCRELRRMTPCGIAYGTIPGKPGAWPVISAA